MKKFIYPNNYSKFVLFLGECPPPLEENINNQHKISFYIIIIILKNVTKCKFHSISILEYSWNFNIFLHKLFGMWKKKKKPKNRIFFLYFKKILK